MKKNQIKVAEIKIGKSEKLYDYFCNDLKIEEGDYVNVEGINFPVFVYDVKYKEESLANKSVLKVLTSNKNVKIYTKYEDVTKIKCDCVVNSLGTKLDVFGSICKAIVTNAHSKEIDDLIKNNPAANIFDTFVTDAGDLKCKKVIHIVMPFKEDDRFNNNLKEAFSRVIDKAIGLGMKSIAIPKIGTGANGYSMNDIYDALRDVTLKYQYTEGIELEIINLLFDTSVSNIAQERRAAERQKVIHRIDSKGIFKDTFKEKTIIASDSISTIDYENIDENRFKTDVAYIYELINYKYKKEEEYFYIPDESANPFRFAWDYGKENKVLHKIGDAGFYTDDMIKKLRTGKRSFKKNDCIRLALYESMNFTLVIQFMQVSGFSFSPSTKNDFDLELFKYIYKYDGFKKGIQHFEEKIVKMAYNGPFVINALLHDSKD